MLLADERAHPVELAAGTRARWRNPRPRAAKGTLRFRRRPGVPCPAAPRPPDLDRRLVPASGGAGFAHAHRRRARVRGTAAGVRGLPRTTSAAGCTSSRATARSWPRRRSRSGRPLWVDDPCFNLEYHVRHAALPAPGTEEQLFLLAGRIASQQLDRSKPLWESWLVEGLEGDRFALIFKTHHSLVDGVSGVDLATVLFDLDPRAGAPPPTDLEPWQPQPEPSPGELVLAGVRGRGPHDGRAGRARAGAPPPGRRARWRAPGRRRGARRDRLGRAQPGARDPAERGDRPPPPLRRRAPGARRTTRRSRTRSAARSTTSC